MLNNSLSWAQTHKGLSTQTNQQTKVPGESDKDTQGRQPMTALGKRRDMNQNRNKVNNGIRSMHCITEGCRAAQLKGEICGEMPYHSATPMGGASSTSFLGFSGTATTSLPNSYPFLSRHGRLCHGPQGWVDNGRLCHGPQVWAGCGRTCCWPQVWVDC